VAVDQGFPSDRGKSPDTAGTELGGAGHCDRPLYLDVATLIKIRDIKGIPTYVARRAQDLAEAGHFPGQSAGVST